MSKKYKIFIIVVMIFFFGNNINADYKKLAYDFKFKDLDGSILSLSEYKNKIMIIIILTLCDSLRPPGTLATGNSDVFLTLWRQLHVGPGSLAPTGHIVIKL